MKALHEIIDRVLDDRYIYEEHQSEDGEDDGAGDRTDGRRVVSFDWRQQNFRLPDICPSRSQMTRFCKYINYQNICEQIKCK